MGSGFEPRWVKLFFFKKILETTLKYCSLKFPDENDCIGQRTQCRTCNAWVVGSIPGDPSDVLLTKKVF